MIAGFIILFYGIVPQLSSGRFQFLADVIVKIIAHAVFERIAAVESPTIIGYFTIVTAFLARYVGELEPPNVATEILIVGLDFTTEPSLDLLNIQFIDLVPALLQVFAGGDDETYLSPIPTGRIAHTELGCELRDQNGQTSTAEGLPQHRGPSQSVPSGRPNRHGLLSDNRACRQGRTAYGDRPSNHCYPIHAGTGATHLE